jgi:amino-acid N-acetyltransferase
MPTEPSEAFQPAAKPEDPLARRAAVTIRPVRFDDLDNILALIEPFVERDVLLPRSEGELIELLPMSFVAEDAGRIIGYVGLEIYSIKLAEVRSLAVASDYQRLGIGQDLVQACVDLARRKGIIEVMAITSKEDFFRQCGFDFTLPGEKKALFIHTANS